MLGAERNRFVDGRQTNQTGQDFADRAQMRRTQASTLCSLLLPAGTAGLMPLEAVTSTPQVFSLRILDTY